MKNATLFGVVFFIMTILAKDVTAVGWQIWYRVNLTYVAKNLCENKARPKMKCNGKCYLAKQLAKAEGENAKKQKPHAPVFKLKSVEALLNIPQQSLVTISFAENQKHYFDYHRTAISNLSETEDHPPCERS